LSLILRCHAIAARRAGPAQPWPELSGTDNRVAAAILEHFNRRTGQSDPSYDRIAKLLGLSRRSVIRSVFRIVDTGVLHMERHRGGSQCNSYERVCSAFRERDNVWRMRFNGRAGIEEKLTLAGAPQMSPAPCQDCPSSGDKAVTQTILSNQFEQTRTSEPASENHQHLGKLRYLKGQPNKKDAHRSRRSRLGWKRDSISSRTAANAAAQRRLSWALHSRFSIQPNVYASILEFIDTDMLTAHQRVTPVLSSLRVAMLCSKLPHRVWSKRRSWNLCNRLIPCFQGGSYAPVPLKHASDPECNANHCRSWI
jgi:hypothetical protein